MFGMTAIVLYNLANCEMYVPDIKNENSILVSIRLISRSMQSHTIIIMHMKIFFVILFLSSIYR